MHRFCCHKILLYFGSGYWHQSKSLIFGDQGIGPNIDSYKTSYHHTNTMHWINIKSKLRNATPLWDGCTYITSRMMMAKTMGKSEIGYRFESIKMIKIPPRFNHKQLCPVTSKLPSPSPPKMVKKGALFGVPFLSMWWDKQMGRESSFIVLIVVILSEIFHYYFDFRTESLI